MANINLKSPVLRTPVLRTTPKNNVYVFHVTNSGDVNYSTFDTYQEAKKYADQIRNNGFAAYIVTSETPISIYSE